MVRVPDKSGLELGPRIGYCPPALGSVISLALSHLESTFPLLENEALLLMSASDVTGLGGICTAVNMQGPLPLLQE